VAAVAAGVDRQLLPERARVLHDTGMMMAEIADELHCATSAVHRHLHSADH
jgi:orotate phosphoribosyltransferase-like protein